MKALSRRRFLRGGLEVLGAAAVGSRLTAARGAAAASISAEDLVPSDRGAMTLLQGAGCNVVAVRGPEGSLLIDGGLAANADALLAAATAATGNARVNTLINTHWHPSQTGSNERVGREGGLIISQEVTRLYLGRAALSACYEGSYGPLPQVAWPKKTTRDTGSLEFAGQHVEYVYLPAAHTDGDLYVHFPERNLLVAGGPVLGDRWPIIDIRNGAWVGGLLNAYEKLASVTKPDTRIIPANGALVTGAEITRRRDIYQKLFTQLFVYLNKGFGPDDVVAAHPLKAYEAELGDPSRFLAGAYESLMYAYVPN